MNFIAALARAGLKSWFGRPMLRRGWHALPAARLSWTGCSPRFHFRPRVLAVALGKIAAPVQVAPVPAVADARSRSGALEALRQEVGSCRRCSLHTSRTNTVFGAGSCSAGLMFVGEAPGYHEDRLGEPFAGKAGGLLDRLLGQMGLSRGDVYIANVLKCRPPGNRDPQPDEIEKCRAFLERQISLVRPGVICTLGNFATKLLSGRPDGISRVHGALQKMPGPQQPALLFPVFHPAAALYSPSNLKGLEADFDRLAVIIGANARGAARRRPKDDSRHPKPVAESETGAEGGIKDDAGGGQLGLF